MPADRHVFTKTTKRILENQYQKFVKQAWKYTRAGLPQHALDVLKVADGVKVQLDDIAAREQESNR